MMDLDGNGMDMRRKKYKYIGNYNRLLLFVASRKNMPIGHIFCININLQDVHALLNMHFDRYVDTFYLLCRHINFISTGI
jgi:hypothetical protein